MHKILKKISIKRISLILLASMVLILLLIIYMFIEPYWLEVKKYEISDKDIPQSFDKYKIVFLSDIHHGPYFSLPRVKSLVEKVNEMEPDLILLGGDYVLSSPEYIKPCFKELKHLKASDGIFGVLGNHDHWESADLSGKAMKEAGIILIDNKSQWIYRDKERIKIGGVGDLWEDRNIDIKPTISDVREDDFVILLSHNPEYAEEINNHKIDLMLSGHTHGGQVTLFGL